MLYTFSSFIIYSLLTREHVLKLLIILFGEVSLGSPQGFAGFVDDKNTDVSLFRISD
jgi:hypothetical protein